VLVLPITMKKAILLLFSLCCFHGLSFAQNFASNWQPLGPVNMPGYETSMGRVSCVAASAGLPARLFIGTPGGGVWRSDSTQRPSLPGR